MASLLLFLYTWFFLPLLIFSAFILSLFNKKINTAFNKRKKILNELYNFQPNFTKTILIHCASMGEFEHIKPLINKLNSFKQFSIILTFFSPSGYDNVKEYPGIEKIIFLPFDRKKTWDKVYNILNPIMLIISKHDIWPYQVIRAKKNGVPVFLVNGSLSNKSTRISIFPRTFLRNIYNRITKIYAISEEDLQNFNKYFPEVNVVYLGDTKFDQVLERKRAAQNKHILPDDWLKLFNLFIKGLICSNSPIEAQ